MTGHCISRHPHPLAGMTCIAAFFTVPMLWGDPIWLCALLLLIAICSPAAVKKAILFSLALAFTFGAVNALLSHTGGAVLWNGPSVPLLGRLTITLEGLLLGISSGIRIVLAVAAFALAGELLEPDDALAMLSRAAPKSALTATLAVLLVPRMRRDLRRIADVMRMRGAALDAPGVIERVRAARPLLHALLMSSLEGAWDIAVALHCRAFGSGRRSSCAKRPWRPRDALIAACAACAIALALAGISEGRGVFSFSAGHIVFPGAADLLVMTAVLLLLAAGLVLCRRY